MYFGRLVRAHLFAGWGTAWPLLITTIQGLRCPSSYPPLLGRLISLPCCRTFVRENSLPHLSEGSLRCRAAIPAVAVGSYPTAIQFPA